MRHRAQIEFDVPAGQTIGETREWVEKWFSYYHPSLKAKVTLVKDAPSDQPDVRTHVGVSRTDVGNIQNVPKEQTITDDLL